MVCKLDRPTPQALFDRTLGNFSANVLGGYDVIPESLEWYVVANDYALQEELYSAMEAQWKARDERYACCDDLYDMAARRGIYPKSAGFAEGYIRVRGTVGSDLPSPLTIQVSGQQYSAVGTYAATIPAEGYVDLRVRAIVPGTDGNVITTQTTATLVTPATGIKSSVTLFGGSFCGGSAAETCEQFRARYIERLTYKPKANDAWIKAKFLEWPCVTRVMERGCNCCTEEASIGGDCTACDCNSCTGDLGYYVFFDDTFDCGIPPQCVIDDINTWMFGDPVGRGLGQVEIGVCGKVYRPTACTIDITIDGMDCATASQVAEVKTRIAEIFRSVAPSCELTARSIEYAVAQVMGTAGPFDVVFDQDVACMNYTPCGDLDPLCDVVACVGDITILQPIREGGC